MKRIFKSLIERLVRNDPDVSIEITWPDGKTDRIGEGPSRCGLSFRNSRAIRRSITRGSLGFGEEYMDGNIEVEGDFTALLRLGFDPVFLKFSSSALLFPFRALRKISNLNTLRGARRNIERHYDLGDDFFGLWLDREMTYSSAYFHTGEESIDEAQRAKYDHICRKLRLEEGMRLLDIGCGWGALAVHAAKRYHVEVTGCTISRKQADYAERHVERLGLGNLVKIVRRDYRELDGSFDRIVSVGMFEHVGRRFYPEFFGAWSRMLKPGGIGVLHTIGRDVAIAPEPWTRRYIFPGSYLPGLSEILDEMALHELYTIDVENLRLHYAMTLEAWADRYERHLDEIREMFDERFVRMWRFFLVGSAVAFRYGDLRLWQMVFTRGLNNDLPLTREHLYRVARPGD